MANDGNNIHHNTYFRAYAHSALTQRLQLYTQETTTNQTEEKGKHGLGGHVHVRVSFDFD
jgi:hypothetical protein